MFIWHVNFHLVSEKIIREPAPTDGWIPPLLTSEQSLMAWDMLSTSVGPAWQTGDRRFAFGPEKGNRVDVSFETPDTASLAIRFDVSSDGIRFLTLMCSVARKLKCVFYFPDTGCFTDPDEDPLVVAIAAAHTAAILRSKNMPVRPASIC